MKKKKFGGLQKIRAGYLDGRLNVEGDIMEKYLGDFAFDDEEYMDTSIYYLLIAYGFFEMRARVSPGPALDWTF